MVEDNNQFDEIDRILLTSLQQDARISNAELARRVELSPTGLHKRLRKLEESGLIQGYVALLDREAMGYDIVCFVQITLERHEMGKVNDFKHAIQTLPEVLECYHLTGEYDYLLKAVVRNRKHLEQFLMEKLTPIPGIDKIRTSIVLSELKATTAVPV